MARNAHITSISFPGIRGDISPQERVKRALVDVADRIDEAALDRPDLIVLPETFAATGCSHEKYATTAEALDGPTVSLLASKAREHGTHIVFGMVQQENNSLYNAGVLLSRSGDILGVYHKMHPTIGELEMGIIPGTESPAWDTDIGRIGCAICFDLNFLDVSDSLSRNRAEIVCFPSAYRGGIATLYWAFKYGFWFVSATPTENSCIVNPLGRLLVESFGYSPTISAAVNTDCVVCHIDFNHGKLPDLKRKYGAQAEVVTVAPEGVFLLTSSHPEVSVYEMIEEFGLETREQYWDRANAARVECLQSERQRQNTG